MMVKDRVMVYIDGLNLYYALQREKLKGYKWLDIRLMCEKILRPNQKLVGVKYFSSKVFPTPDDRFRHKRQLVYLAAIDTLPDVFVIRGRFQKKERICPKCKGKYRQPEEKMTDVSFGIEVVSDGMKDEYDVAVLVTNDTDQVPTIKKTRIECPKKRVIIVFPPGSGANDLKKAVDEEPFFITPSIIRSSQLPDEVKGVDGSILRRPEEWLKKFVNKDVDGVCECHR